MEFLEERPAALRAFNLTMAGLLVGLACAQGLLVAWFLGSLSRQSRADDVTPAARAAAVRVAPSGCALSASLTIRRAVARSWIVTTRRPATADMRRGRK